LSARAGDVRPLRSSSSVEACVREAIGWRPQTVGRRTLHIVAMNAIERPVLSWDGVPRSPEYVEVRPCTQEPRSSHRQCAAADA
jgi:hypothetical protein